MPKKHIKRGFSTSNRYSKHGIERVVERVVSNNPNDLKKKKQKRLISKATKNVKQAKKNFFAYYEDFFYTYRYVNINQDLYCDKYIFTSKGRLITVIKNINFRLEIQKYNIKYHSKHSNCTKPRKIYLKNENLNIELELLEDNLIKTIN